MLTTRHRLSGSTLASSAGGCCAPDLRPRSQRDRTRHCRRCARLDGDPCFAERRPCTLRRGGKRHRGFARTSDPRTAGGAARESRHSVAQWHCRVPESELIGMPPAPAAAIPTVTDGFAASDGLAPLRGGRTVTRRRGRSTRTSAKAERVRPHPNRGSRAKAFLHRLVLGKAAGLRVPWSRRRHSRNGLEDHTVADQAARRVATSRSDVAGH